MLRVPPDRGLGVEALALGAQLVGEDVRDEILFRVEVGVEGAVGQAGVGHHGGHAGAIDAVLLEAPSGRFEDPLSGGLLVALVVAQSDLSRRTGFDRAVGAGAPGSMELGGARSRPTIVLWPYYYIMIVMQSRRRSASWRSGQVG